MTVKRIAVLAACHDRAKQTLRCLESLSSAHDRCAGRCGVEAFLVDDGSTDGTAALVRDRFPAVRVIPADGSLFWARSMEKAWVEAEKSGPWDGFLWLNDDTVLNGDALERLLAADDGESIVVGDIADSSGRKIYGLGEGGMFTGNFTYVPDSAYRRLGRICGEYSHAWADTDYAVRAKRAGIPARSAGVVGTSEWHPLRPPLRGVPLRRRLAMLRDPKGWCLRDLWLFRRRNWGVAAALASCAHMALHVAWGGR